ncbi:mechanosensitive ion channel family protein [Acaryochloris sp. CCMEE 5410]|uniref:mechanosensitive ion channel family protein n=1 Tax=Acaryochloris sp. CCMEE 5410 TaxID=310037 RepID=UPI0002484CC0|nr:mechanosensitive ion channel family protein [Acaryochloris sp. CCMEE 5410]
MNTNLSIAWSKVQVMLNRFIALLPNIALALFVFAGFLVVSRIVKDLLQYVVRDRIHTQNLKVVLGRLVQGAVILVGAFIALSIVMPSLKADDLVQLFGVSGVAIGFAFRDILQNFLSGVLILLTQPFQIDDQIVYQDYEGTVEEIQTRATTIRTYDNRRIVIPNSELFTNSVLVNTAFEKRRLQYDIGIHYDADIDQASQLILAAMQETEGVLADPAPEVLVVDLAPSTVNLRARWWMDPPRRADVLEMTSQILKAIKNKLMAQGIDLPYPTQQILMQDQANLTHDGHDMTSSPSNSKIIQTPT